MAEYLARRSLLSLLSIFLVRCIVFVSVRLMPGESLPWAQEASPNGCGG